jgi:chromosome segregation ATPase
LLTPLFRIPAEKEQLAAEHHKVRSLVGELKEELVQAELRHDRERKEAKAAAEAKLDETLKECADSTAVLRAELEEESGARKAAQDRIALLEAEQKEYDRLVLQTDALALRKFLFFFSVFCL